MPPKPSKGLTPEEKARRQANLEAALRGEYVPKRYRQMGLVPPVPDSPITSDSPDNGVALALPDVSPITHDSPSVRGSPKPEDTDQPTPAGTGDSRIKHAFFDSRLCGLEPIAQLLYFHLNRYRAGASNLTIVVSWKRLAERIPKSEQTIRRAYKQLNRAGLVFKVREVYTKKGEQGNVFRVVTSDSPITDESPSTGDTHKRTALKANDKKGALCAKCGGTGFWYPEGFGKGGVVKCDHR